MSRLFIIGAGFSKALADAPLANGFIKAIYDETLNQDMKYQHAGEWRSDRTAFQKLLKHFHESTTKLVESLEQNDSKKILNRDFESFLESLNIEFLCSFLDLHITHCFIPLAKGVNLQGCPIPLVNGFHQYELKSALKFIKHHMLELLLEENLSLNTSAFDKMSDFFREGDNVISFNYDLLIEQMLWKRKLWNPFDGYGFEFKRNGNEDVHESRITIIKVHGSINWRSPDILFHPDLQLAISHPFKDEPLFEGLKIENSIHNKTKYIEYPICSHVILPTFAKSPRYNWELRIVNKALEFCRNAEEVYILGYSFPEADYITNLLFSEMNHDACLKIILWDKNKDVAKELRSKIIKKYSIENENVKHENSSIESWINSGFEFTAYERYLKEQAEMEQVLNISKRK